ncbi:MAG: PAS domain-containing protein [Verrucomicrobia bacterium]|nr:PAS domain-containing protein [Verrucomicrobiota bacterium]
MGAEPLRILQIEDSAAQARLLEEILRGAMDAPYELKWVDRLSAGLEHLEQSNFDLVLLDLGLPDSQGLNTFERLYARHPLSAVIVLSGLDDEGIALKALQAGAQDYLVKGQVDGRLLVRAIRYAVERKRVREMLTKERDLLEALIQSLPDQIYVKDAAGRFLRANGAVASFFNLATVDALYGKTDFDFFPHEMARPFHEEEQRIIGSGEPVINREACIADQSGGNHWMLTTKVPFRDHNGAIIGTVGINRDVTQMKMAEEELRRANTELARSEAELQKAVAELQKAHDELRAAQMQLVEVEKLQVVGRLAAGVAHEVKNPLAVTLRGIEYLSKSMVAKDEVVTTVLKDMNDAIRRADAVIRGMLDFAAPRQIEVRSEDVNAVIERALWLVKHDLDRRCITVNRWLEHDLPRCMIDLQKMEEVFINVMENAVHAMPAGGSLTVRTYARQLTGFGTNVGDSKVLRFKMGATVVIAEIEDTGIGIPPDKLSKIFDPFFTTKPTGQGTGLGLSVCKTIIELHGGAIDIRNRKEGGAQVAIMLKAERKE